MERDELLWKRDSPLKSMMDNYNKLVEQVDELSRQLNQMEDTMTSQHKKIKQELHKLTDTCLGVNKKVDDVNVELENRITTLNQLVSRYHPHS